MSTAAAPISALRAIRRRLLDATEAPTVLLALRRIGEFAALRGWAMLMNCFPVEWNRQTARLMGRCWWLLMRKHRRRAMVNLIRALGRRTPRDRLFRIARLSFEHFAQLYLVELVMTPQLVTEWSWDRYVELDPGLAPGLREMLSRDGVIMLTAHFGNYELLGYTLARIGLPITAIMRPLDNPLINEYLVRSRAAGGVTLLMKRNMSQYADAVLRSGEPLCFIADQDAGSNGMFVEFFGRRASTYKSIGLLAMSRRVPIVVGHAVRIGDRFRYRIGIERIIRVEEWDSQSDPLRWITREFNRALENAIRRHPEQYLWMHRRWKHVAPDQRPADQRGRRRRKLREGGKGE